MTWFKLNNNYEDHVFWWVPWLLILTVIGSEAIDRHANVS